LFDIFIKFGSLFSTEFWNRGFHGALLEVFGCVGYKDGCICNPIDSEWLNTTCFQALQYMMAVLKKYFDTLTFLVPEVFVLLRAFVMDANINLANIGCTYLFQFVADDAQSFSPSMWNDFDSVLEVFFARHVNMMKLLNKGYTNDPQMVKEDKNVEDSVSSEGSKSEDEDEEQEEAGEAKEKQAEENEETKKDEEENVDKEAKDENVETKEEEEEPKKEEEEEKKTDCEEPKPVEEAKKICEVCQKENDLLRCPMCNSSFFCSEKCMREGWSAHRAVCLNKCTEYNTMPVVVNTDMRNFAILTREDPDAKTECNGSLQVVGLTTVLVQDRSDVMRLMLNLMEDLVKKQYAYFRTEDLVRLADSLAGCITTVSAVLSSQSIRGQLSKCKLLQRLLRNESESAAFYLNMLFLMFKDKEIANEETQKERREYARPRLVSMCDEILSQRYKDEWDESTTVTLLLLVLNSLKSVEDQDYVTFLPHYFPAFASLVIDKHDDVRGLVQKHLNRLTPYLSFSLPGSQ